MVEKALHQALDLRSGHCASGGIGGRVEDDEARSRGEEGEHRLRVEREVPLLEQGNRHRPGAAPVDDRLVDGKAGVGIENLRSRLAEHGDSEEHRDLAAGDDDDAARIDLDRAPGREVRGDRFAQLEDSGRRGVAVVSVAQGLHRCLDHVSRSIEVRLADTEVDNVVTLPGQGVRPREHLEGGLGAETGHFFGEDGHGPTMARFGELEGSGCALVATGA